MKQRCYYKKHKAYHRYGGRGIVVCDEWQSIKEFRKWALENGYRDNLTLDRINNDGNYEPSNCRWVTHRAQAANRSHKSNTGYVGVHRRNNRFSATIRYKRKLYHLGVFNTLEEAVKIRKKAERILQNG